MSKKVWLIIGGVVLLFVIVVLVISLSKNNTGNKSASGTATLTIWSPFNEAAVYNQISTDYLQANPNVKINFQYIQASSDAEYEAKITNALAAGNGPDIWLMRADWLPKHINKISPADDSVRFSKDKNQSNQDFVGQALSSAVAAENSSGGKLYGVPMSVDTLALYVNKKALSDTVTTLQNANLLSDAEVLNSTPLTWDQLAKWSRLLTKKDSQGNITRSGLSLGTTSNTNEAVDTYLALLYQHGGTLFNTDTKTPTLNLASTANSTDFPAQDALSYLSSFSNKTNANYSWDKSLGDPVQALLDGKTSIVIGSSVVGQQILQKNSQPDFINILPLPQLQEVVLPTQHRIDYATYWTQVVSKGSTNKAAAWSYIEAIATSKASQYSQATGKPDMSSIASTVVNSRQNGSVGDSSIFAYQASDSIVAGKNDWQVDDLAITNMVNNVVDSSQSIKAAIDTATLAITPK